MRFALCTLHFALHVLHFILLAVHLTLRILYFNKWSSPRRRRDATQENTGFLVTFFRSHTRHMTETNPERSAIAALNSVKIVSCDDAMIGWCGDGVMGWWHDCVMRWCGDVAMWWCGDGVLWWWWWRDCVMWWCWDLFGDVNVTSVRRTDNIFLRLVFEITQQVANSGILKTMVWAGQPSISDNMDRWKSRGGKSQRGERQSRRWEKRKSNKENNCRRAKK